jgi:hypothetical protein
MRSKFKREKRCALVLHVCTPYTLDHAAKSSIEENWNGFRFQRPRCANLDDSNFVDPHWFQCLI